MNRKVPQPNGCGTFFAVCGDPQPRHPPCVGDIAVKRVEKLPDEAEDKGKDFVKNRHEILLVFPLYVR